MADWAACKMAFVTFAASFRSPDAVTANWSDPMAARTSPSAASAKVARAAGDDATPHCQLLNVSVGLVDEAPWASAAGTPTPTSRNCRNEGAYKSLHTQMTGLRRGGGLALLR